MTKDECLAVEVASHSTREFSDLGQLDLNFLRFRREIGVWGVGDARAT